MKRSTIALSILLGATIIGSGISVAAFASADKTSKSENAVTTATPDELPPAAHHFPLTSSVSDLKKTSEEANLITLSWEPAESATGYYVYLCDRDVSDTFTLVSQVSEPTVDLMNLKDTSPYWVKVTAYMENNGIIYESHPTLLKTATQAVDVASLDTLSSSDVLKFCWPSPSDNRITGYNIYRSCRESDSEYVLYDTLGIDRIDFEDDNVEEGEFYRYKVCPYREIDGVQYEAKGKTIDFISGLSSPANLIARSVSKHVVLNWSHRDLASGYNIFMSTSEKTGYQSIGSTEKNSFNTKDLDASKTYYFRVQPYKTMDDGTTALGTWSSCKITMPNPADKKKGPKSSISGNGTFIEISIDQQHMWFYENGKLILDTDVVTGNKGNNDTPKGTYYVESLARDTTLTGEGYSSFVKYWIGFYGGYGIHDASWRSSYGGTIYKGNGSHGCVNTPLDKVKKIYEKVDYGTPVYVY